MAKKKYVVRVVQTHTDNGTELNEGAIIDDAFLECLRYAGLVTNHPINDETSLTSRCFDIRAPHGVLSDVWAEQNAARMRSFGFNAVKAPSTF